MDNDAGMFSPVTAEEIADPQTKTRDTAQDEWIPITPIPLSAFPLQAKLRGKDPRSTWTYYDAEARPLGVECRWLTDTGKEVRFATWCRNGDGREAWRFKHLLPPRPIFGLDRLAQRPLAPVLIVEGPNKCKPAEQLFPDYVAIAWPGGAKSAHLVDWTPLKGRKVRIWPDNDDAGRKAAAQIASLALAAGAESALVVPVPTDFPRKWDLADKAPDGVDLAGLLAAAGPAKDEPRYVGGFQMLDRGLVWRDPSDQEKPEVLVAGPFEILALVRDDTGRAWGLLLRWKDPDGRTHEWAMPRALLAGDGADFRRVLLDGGLYLATSLKARNLFNTFLSSARIERRARAVSGVGWDGATFVLPDGAIGKPDGERAILQTTGPVEHAFNVRGSLAEWQDKVAKYALGNSRLLLAISAAFAAAVVEACGVETGGIHLRGPSSIGKTTALIVAGSAWGGGERTRYVKSWRSTSNGLEAVATVHNHTLLCLDELAQASPKEAGEVIYMLAGGVGRARASRDTTLRKTPKWRLLFLSSGEIGLADKIAEDMRGRRVTAGQYVRVVDLPAATGVYGLFEDLHGFADAGSFARHLVEAASQFYGTAARAFINKIAPELEGLREAVAEAVRSFVSANCPEGSDGQVERIAGRFGLIGAAGEIAAGLQIVPWEAGAARTAAETCFAACLSNRGGIEAAEIRDGINAVRTFLSAHCTSRFLAPWDDGENGKIMNLAGFRRKVETSGGPSWDYYLTAGGWAEACTGFDAKALAVTLVERGMMSPQDARHRAKSIRIPGHGIQRLYHLLAKIMEGGND
jgi:uncharacterized protein (DUF927 family)